LIGGPGRSLCLDAPQPTRACRFWLCASNALVRATLGCSISDALSHSVSDDDSQRAACEFLFGPDVRRALAAYDNHMLVLLYSERCPCCPCALKCFAQLAELVTAAAAQLPAFPTGRELMGRVLGESALGLASPLVAPPTGPRPTFVDAAPDAANPAPAGAPAGDKQCLPAPSAASGVVSVGPLTSVLFGTFNVERNDIDPVQFPNLTVPRARYYPALPLATGTSRAATWHDGPRVNAREFAAWARDETLAAIAALQAALIDAFGLPPSTDSAAGAAPQVVVLSDEGRLRQNAAALVGAVCAEEAQRVRAVFDTAAVALAQRCPNTSEST
jgi:hypothetical protein